MEFERNNLTPTSGVGGHNEDKDWSLGIEAFFTGKGEPHTASIRWEVPKGVVPYADYWNVSMAPTIPDGRATDKEKVWLSVALVRAWLHIEDEPSSGMMILNANIRCRREPSHQLYYLVQPEPKQFKYMTVAIEFAGYIQRGARANVEVQAMGSLRTTEQAQEMMDKFLGSLEPAGPTQ